MLYFLHLLKVPHGSDPLEFSRKLVVEEDEDLEFPELSRSDIDHLAAAAKRAWPDLEGDPEESSEGNYDVELNPKDAPGDLGIEIFSNGALVSLADDARADDVFWHNFGAALQSIAFAGGLVLYDETLDRIVDPAREMAVIRQSYEAHAAKSTAVSKSHTQPSGLMQSIVLLVVLMAVGGILISLGVLPAILVRTWMPLVIVAVILVTLRNRWKYLKSRKDSGHPPAENR